jgi:hypothetical protein
MSLARRTCQALTTASSSNARVHPWFSTGMCALIIVKDKTKPAYRCARWNAMLEPPTDTPRTCA